MNTLLKLKIIFATISLIITYSMQSAVEIGQAMYVLTRSLPEVINLK